MNYLRNWADSRNAVGFAAGCARLALPFYRGDHRSDLVAAIEIGERCAADALDIAVSIDAARDAAGAADADDSDDYCAARAAACAANATVRASYADYASDAAYYAGVAGVDSSEIQIAYARRVVRDLTCGRELPEELRQAAGAAIVAGDEDLARELVQGT